MNKLAEKTKGWRDVQIERDKKKMQPPQSTSQCSVFDSPKSSKCGVRKRIQHKTL